ncbi:DEAD/DEAH box helicase [Flavicella sp.]|uniref:DEAD/DEAH box helicase n=1 Tax=Flavicella sp. TaxID=2957742 RepID=UPI003019910A
MPFKKLNSNIKERLEFLKITAPTKFQSSSIPVIKSGVNVYCTASKNSGKTTTLILTTLHKLKCEAVGSAPRAFVLVENKERALELYDLFSIYTRYNSLRVYVAHEQIHIDLQKSEIFEGIDILIASTESMNKLFLLNGISISSIKLFSIDDAEFLLKRSGYATLLSMSQSIKKCQFVLYSEKIPPKLRGLDSYFMEHSRTVSS